MNIIFPLIKYLVMSRRSLICGEFPSDMDFPCVKPLILLHILLVMMSPKH